MNDLIVPYIFLQNKDINLFDAVVLAYIKANMNEDYNCNATDADIANYLQVNELTIPNTLSRLNKLGFIEKIEDKNRLITYTYDAPNRGASDIGYIYIMMDLTHKYLKIGFSKNPAQRESTLQGEKPTIQLVKKFKGTMAEEQTVHRILARHRKRGEWFDVTQEQAEEAIKKVIGL